MNVGYLPRLIASLGKSNLKECLLFSNNKTLIESQTPSKMKVITGTNLLDEGGDRYEVEKLIQHPDYDSGDIVNDIALVHLKENITYGPLVKPVQLPVENTEVGKRLLLSGWGTTAVRNLTALAKTKNHKKHFHYCISLSRCCSNILLNENKNFCCPIEASVFLVFLLSHAVSRQDTEPVASNFPEFHRLGRMQEDSQGLRCERLQHLYIHERRGGSLSCKHI